MPGRIEKNKPEKEYRPAPGFSVSQTKGFHSSESPWHWFKRNLCPNKPKVEFNPNFIVGTLLHSRVELGIRFEESHCILPKGIKRGGPSWRKFMAENAGKTPVRQADWDLTQAMYKSIMDHSGARELLKDGEHEESLFLEHQGIKLKGRTDFRKPCEYIADIKTTACGSPTEHMSYFGPLSFRKAVLNGKLHWQAAFYQFLAEEITGASHDFVFIAVEKTHPFDVSLHTLSKSLLASGRECVFEALERLNKHYISGEWPRYGNQIHVVEEK